MTTQTITKVSKMRKAQNLRANIEVSAEGFFMGCKNPEPVKKIMEISAGGCFPSIRMTSIANSVPKVEIFEK